jgi:hypothetical protein
MIRTIVLIGLLIIIFYCAFANSARAVEMTGAIGKAAEAPGSRLDLRARRQFIPGSMAALHGHARNLAMVSARATTADPSA